VAISPHLFKAFVGYRSDFSPVSFFFGGGGGSAASRASRSAFRRSRFLANASVAFSCSAIATRASASFSALRASFCSFEDAHDGAESEAFAAKANGDTSLNTVINEQTDQILQWKDIVENEISFLLATSLQGAVVQLAILQDTLNDLEERVAKLDDDDAGRILFKMRRLTRSVIEVVYQTLGKDGVAPVFDVVDTYGEVAGRPKNWLCNIPAWSDAGFNQRRVRVKDRAKAEAVEVIG